jgi:hypothetical protein
MPSMSSLDVSHLSAPDAIVALRSYPRRFRQAFAVGPDEIDIEELAHRLSPDGHSAIEALHDTTSTLVLLDQALHQVAVHDDPVLHPAVGDTDARGWPLPPGFTVMQGLDELDAEIGVLVEAAERVHGEDWNRSGRVAADGTITALDVLREAVLVGVHGLRRAEQSQAAARHHA